MLGEHYGLASEFALVVGLVAASFAVAQPIVTVFAKLIIGVRERRLERRFSKLLISPTPEEIKRYSVQTYENRDKSGEDKYSALLEARKRALLEVRAEVRVWFLALGFLFAFLTVGARFALLMLW